MRVIKNLLACLLLLSMLASCGADYASGDISAAEEQVQEQNLFTALWYNEAGGALSILEQVNLTDSDLATHGFNFPAEGKVLDSKTDQALIFELFGAGAIEAINSRTGDGFVLRPMIELDLVASQAEKNFCQNWYLEAASYCLTINDFSGSGQCIIPSVQLIPGWCIMIDGALPEFGCAIACGAI